MSKRHTHTVWRGKFEDGCPRCIELAKAPAAPTDTPSDLVKRLYWVAGKLGEHHETTDWGHDVLEAADRIEQLAEAEKFRDYFERESIIWRKRAEKAGRERDEALISALGMEYDENGWQDLARAALDMYGRKP